MFLALAALLSPCAQVDEVRLAAHSPSPSHPFGTPHPDAPPELAQFAFMIGEFDCVDEILQPDGTWKRTDAIWNARYFLDGRGIQDRYWSDEFATTNIRLFDADSGQWRVNFARTPVTSRVSHGQWLGRQVLTDEGPTMVMWAGSEDGANGSRLTFHEIRPDGFEWISESLRDGVATPNWRSSCKRRVHGGAFREPRFQGYDQDAIHPFGRIHPDAPRALAALELIVGSFRTTAVDPDAQAACRSAYVLNGWALQQDHFELARASARLYFYDESREVFVVSEFEMPGARWTVWESSAEGDRLTFSEEKTRDATPPTGRSFQLRPEEPSDFVLLRSTDGDERTTERRFTRLR